MVEQRSSISRALTTSQRIRAVRPEVINALSFLSVVWTLFDEEGPSFRKTLFILTGICILLIDFFLFTANGISRRIMPFLSKRSTEALDDLLSDLPQSFWILLYNWNFKFSLIALVCGLHSAFSIMEDVAKMKD